MQELQESQRFVLSFGGGVNSVALMVLLIQEDLPLDEVLFADTGSELPETYDYLTVAEEYCRKHGVPFVTVRKASGVSLYDHCLSRKVIPSAVWRWSTRDFKVTPIHRRYRSTGGHIHQYLAIAYDEIERMKTSRVEYVTNLFPLVDRRITRQGCIEIIESAGLPVPVKSGCFFCPFNSAERWAWLNRAHPSLYKKAIRLEESSKHFPSQRLTDQVFRTREKVTLREFRARLRRKSTVPSEPVMVPCGGECMT
jgi:3'-phosphoadenosine 5'-phosphosulfate sulfotransferase (PAPS reductase)/FAD synthetase